MSATALDLAAQELAALRKQNVDIVRFELQRKSYANAEHINNDGTRGPPPTFNLSSITDGVTVSRSQLAALQRAQSDGSLKYQAGQLQHVHTVDETGRRTRHFLGDSAACWNDFRMPVRRVASFGAKKL